MSQNENQINGRRHDLILAVNGYRPISDYLHALRPEGVYVAPGGSMLQLFQAALHGRKTSETGKPKTRVMSLVQSQKDLIILKDLLENWTIMPIIDGCYLLNKTAEAFRYFEREHPRGKVVITVS